MTEPRAGLKRGYYLLNTDGRMASNRRRGSGDRLGRAAIGALLRTPRLLTVAQTSKVIGPATQTWRSLRGKRRSSSQAFAVSPRAELSSARMIGGEVALPHDVLVPKPVAQASVANARAPGSALLRSVERGFDGCESDRMADPVE
jgi:hypothetical protein